MRKFDMALTELALSSGAKLSMEGRGACNLLICNGV